MTDEELAAFEAEFSTVMDTSIQAFIGAHGEDLKGLTGLSKVEIGSVTPDNTDLEEYDKLISLVKLASQKNMDNALLVARIRELGEVAITIACMDDPLNASRI